MDLDNPAWVYETYQVPALFGRWARVLIDLASPAPGAQYSMPHAAPAWLPGCSRRWSARAAESWDSISIRQ